MVSIMELSLLYFLSYQYDHELTLVLAFSYSYLPCRETINTNPWGGCSPGKIYLPQIISQSLMYIPLNTPCCSDLNTLQVGIVPGSQMKMLVTVNRSYINRTTLRSIVPRRNAVMNTSQDPRRA